MMRDYSALRSLSICLFMLALSSTAGEHAARGAESNRGVRLAVETDRPTYQPGDAIGFRVTVSNASANPVTLRCKDSQRFDVTVQDSTEKEVWRWSADRMFAQMMSEDTLAPGQSRSYTASFTGNLPLGQYRASGTIVCLEPPPSASIVFNIR